MSFYDLYAIIFFIKMLAKHFDKPKKKKRLENKMKCEMNMVERAKNRDQNEQPKNTHMRYDSKCVALSGVVHIDVRLA